MKNLAEQIHKLLIKNKKTISVAESCTGGLVSKILTELSGSSKYFILGIIPYSNAMKVKILKIPPGFISQKGAVSKEIALKMARQIRKIAKTDFGIGLTGIAGPTGGTAQKPVGTVFIAVASQDKCICKKFLFTGKRAAIKRKAALKALALLNAHLYCDNSA